MSRDMTAEELAAQDRRCAALAEVMVLASQIQARQPAIASDQAVALDEVRSAMSECRSAMVAGDVERRRRAIVRMAAVCLAHLEGGMANWPCGATGYAPTVF
jgi:hypothetical protein